ncbi:putative disease resistance protein RGA4 [Papaver somniferum]|uniref:putative disease resistance protein RGA4 n=1 Tax=Papaver somniferum TaxID=3469 RepID=UPI000E7011D0|nr:putative disease resistance protein RGA4 [Papaver somniferum]
MAEGFIHPANAGRTRNSAEDTGNHYFYSLLSNSFFQDVKYDKLGDVNEFKMHDLVHDLAQSVVDSNEVAILKASEMEKDGACDIRRLQLIIGGVLKTDVNPLNNAKKLRTVFCQENAANLYRSPVNNKHLRVIYSLSSSSPKPYSLFSKDNDIQEESPSSSFEFIHLRYLDLSRLSYSRITNAQVDSISQLYNLQTLNLHQCKNVGNILEGIASLKSLRHLNLSYSDVKVLPDSIVSLTNLQTLDISHCSRIRVLPPNIGSLQNLVSFDFRDTQNLQKLPDSFGELTKLKSLDLEDTYFRELPESLTSNLCKFEFVNLGDQCCFPEDIKNWVELRSLVHSYGLKDFGEDSDKYKYQIMPTGIEMLTRLEVLDSYVVRNKKHYTGTTIGSSGIEDLAALNSLRELTIKFLDNVRGKMDAERAKLKDKHNIQKLYLKWVHKDEEEEWILEEEEEVAYNSCMVLEGLQPHPHLELLSLQYFVGVKLPKWMGSSSCLPNLVELYFEDCQSCEKLPALGMLPCLKVLHMQRMKSVKCLGEEFYYQQQEQEGESSITTLFPSLIQLKIELLNYLEEWVAPTCNAFPVLEDLSIRGCMRLKSIPDLRLCTCLRRVDIMYCNKLKESIPYDLKNLTFLKHLRVDFDLIIDDSAELISSLKNKGGGCVTM